MKKRILRAVTIVSAMLLLLCSVPVFTAFAATEYPNTHTNTGDMAADIVAVAATQVGYCEGSLSGNPSSASSNNYQKYGLWYDNNVDYIGVQRAAWCAAFVSWCANQAGVPSDIVYYHAYCPYGVTWFKNQGRFQSSASRGGSYTPKAGDIIYFAPAGSSTSSHIGIVRAVDSSYVYTIEGNTSGQNGEVNEGGGVFAKTYSLSYSRILGYGIPNYETTPGATADKLGTYRITASSLNVRAGTDTSYDVVGEVVNGDLVYVTALSNGWGKITLADGTSGWCAISQYGEYVGVDALNSELTAAWGGEYLTTTTNADGSVTFTNANTTDQIAVDMPLLLPIGNKTTPSFNISVTPHAGGYYFGLTKSGTGYFMMRDCTSGDELVQADTAPYMTGQETLQIDISYWWAPEEGYQIDTVRLYLDAASSLTVNYCYFASAADLVTDTTYNMRKGDDTPSVDDVPSQEPVADPVNLMLPDTLAIVDRTKTGGYTYENGILTVTSGEADGYDVTLTPNVSLNPEELKRWLISVETDVRFDIELLVTTADGERTFSLADDFYTQFADARDGEYIPAFTGSAGLGFLGCFTYNDVLPADGYTTVKSVTIRVGGIGTVIVDEIQLAANDVLVSFADSVVKSDSTPDVYEPGDADLSGTVDTSDVRTMLFFAVGGSIMTNTQKAYADYDGDGVVTTADARAVLAALAV